MDRAPGLSVRLKLALSYAAFLMVGGTLLLAVVWIFLLRGTSVSIFVPAPSNLLRAFDPTNFGPIIFGPAAVGVMAFLLVFGLLGGWVLAGRMIAPLTRITNVTRMVAEGSLSHRIGLQGHKDEFRELADAFDAMLERIEAHVAEQQRFAANTSHELRTPLAITQTLLDVARNDPNRNAGELVERLHDVNARAIDLTEALLVLSRADQRAFTKAQVDLSLVAEEAIEALLLIAEKHSVAIETSCAAAPVIGSNTLLLQMATNLVHNAIVHNLPERGTVWVTTDVRLGQVMLVVENTGEELSPNSVAVLVEPFQRGTGRVHTGQVGVGLGLAIVRSIAQAHDGTLTLAPRPSGGLRVVVQLPVLPTAAQPLHC
ncbi:HAMP domain-containing sensor histidine kinase [Nitratireductor sp. ZSWI3]|uniref:sensor histidine kinase n=1 Tax=Nitratireductor sp. ZSWI3 TaxID=2966359 RepID=UPI0021505679|nr:HAMP domain-containing sensor histidine kinase [Nitratireductor sp. ZSWI3]MCR4268555.1 HAMP domain-containing histidine kinase [Nitratireductor sp. ZSWI3]